MLRVFRVAYCALILAILSLLFIAACVKIGELSIALRYKDTLVFITACALFGTGAWLMSDRP